MTGNQAAPTTNNKFASGGLRHLLPLACLHASKLLLAHTPPIQPSHATNPTLLQTLKNTAQRRPSTHQQSKIPIPTHRVLWQLSSKTHSSKMSGSGSLSHSKAYSPWKRGSAVMGSSSSTSSYLREFLWGYRSDEGSQCVTLLLAE